MNYISTRGFDNAGVSSAMAIKKGLADDGGLYMPESIPEIDLDFIRALTSLSYPERAAKVLSLFLQQARLILPVRALSKRLINCFMRPAFVILKH
jgi:threonine synthase